MFTLVLSKMRGIWPEAGVGVESKCLLMIGT